MASNSVGVALPFQLVDLNYLSGRHMYTIIKLQVVVSNMYMY